MKVEPDIKYLLSRLAYQYSGRGVTTMGYCDNGENGCTKPARGGNTCPDCIVAELAKVGVHKAKAQAYQSILAQTQKLFAEADELYEEITEYQTTPAAPLAESCISDTDPLAQHQPSPDPLG